MDTKHLGFIAAICDEDKEGLMAAEQQYKGSWKRRGGTGAYMMLCRKWDRIENAVEGEGRFTLHGNKVSIAKAFDYAIEKLDQCLATNTPWGEQDMAQCLTILKAVREDERFDIFGKIAGDKRAEGIIDDIRDLRRYLVLVEAEMRARGSESANSTHRDNAKIETTVVPANFCRCPACEQMRALHKHDDPKCDCEVCREKRRLYGRDTVLRVDPNTGHLDAVSRTAAEAKDRRREDLGLL